MEINKENIDEIYKKVQKELDGLLSSGISIEAICSYLKPNSFGYNKFIKRTNLEKYKGIKKVISDALDDLKAMTEMDILTFENFNVELSPSNLSEIESNIKKAKFLSDFYSTPLGRVDVLSGGYFDVTPPFSDKIRVFVIDNDEKKILEDYIKEQIFNQLDHEPILSFLDRKIPMTNLINKEHFLNTIRIYDRDIKNFLEMILNRELKVIEKEYILYA